MNIEHITVNGLKITANANTAIGAIIVTGPDGCIENRSPGSVITFVPGC
jgi:hypothetical protein